LNIPTNKRRERSIEAASYEATRPATIAALNESLLSSMVDETASSAFFDDIVGFSMGSLGDADPTHNNARPTVYDDEYGSAPRGSLRAVEGEPLNGSDGDPQAPSEELIEEKRESIDRGELYGPVIITPFGKDGQRDSFADTDEGRLTTEDDEISRGSDDSRIDGRRSPDELESHVLGLNNLMTLQSQRKYDWRPSSSDVGYTSEMELFVEDGDEEGDGIEQEDLVVDVKPQQIPLPSGSYDDGEGVNASDEENAPDQQPKSRSSIRSNPDDTVPVDIASIKEMKKEDYWNLFNRILHMPTDFVPEDHGDPLEFIKRRDEARRERARAAAQSSPKPKRQRARRRKSFEGPTRSRSVEVFEPPSSMTQQRPRPPRRSSSFNGTTVQERATQNGQHHQNQNILSKLPFMHNVRFHRPKKPEFVALVEHKTHEFGKRAREATLALSSKFHSTKKLEN